MFLCSIAPPCLCLLVWGATPTGCCAGVSWRHAGITLSQLHSLWAPLLHCLPLWVISKTKRFNINYYLFSFLLWVSNHWYYYYYLLWVSKHWYESFKEIFQIFFSGVPSLVPMGITETANTFLDTSQVLLESPGGAFHQQGFWLATGGQIGCADFKNNMALAVSTTRSLLCDWR